jgi:hypothetical protein
MHHMFGDTCAQDRIVEVKPNRKKRLIPIVGVVVAVVINLWMVTQSEMARLSLVYVLLGVVMLLLRGQGAVLAPALRPAPVSPSETTG